MSFETDKQTLDDLNILVSIAVIRFIACLADW